MSRNVKEAMNRIFQVLIDSITPEEKDRIVQVERHIYAAEDHDPIIDFVKNANHNRYDFFDITIAFFHYKNDNYLMFPQKYEDAVNDLGFDVVDDSTVRIGTSMIAIGEKSLPINKSVSSLDIIEQSGLGIEPPDSQTSVIIDYSGILKLFTPFSVVKYDSARFPVEYEEDAARLITIFLTYQGGIYSEDVYRKIRDLLLLDSSRTIALPVAYFCKSSINEYGFLQLYQCLEYLFIIVNSIEISNKLGLDVNDIINVVVHYELKKSESENLLHVMRKAAESTIDVFISNLNYSIDEEQSDKHSVVSQHIYKLRCNIAHLRFNQSELTLAMGWEQLISSFVEIIISIYSNLDAEIISICKNNNSWNKIK